jgi:tetratricopeptide (TPR) repeat protein
MEISAKLAGNDPSNIQWQRDLSASYNSIGYVQSVHGDLKAALESYRKGMEIIAKLAGNNPSNMGWQRDLSISYDRIGDVQRAQGDLEEARGSYRKALEILTRLAALHAENTTWKVDLAYSHWEMAYLLGTMPSPDKRQSGSACRSALEILRPLARQDRLAAEEAGWVREIETLLSSLTAPQKAPNKPPNRKP